MFDCSLAALEKSRIRGWLAKRIFEKVIHYDEGILVGIFGPTGGGKSQYAMKIAYQFYRDWNTVLDHIVFTPFEFEEKAEKAQREGFKYAILIWDDAGPWFELIKRVPWDPLAISVVGHIETMRTWCGALIVTMTTEKHFPRAIKDNGEVYIIYVG